MELFSELRSACCYYRSALRQPAIDVSAERGASPPPAGRGIGAANAVPAFTNGCHFAIEFRIRYLPLILASLPFGSAHPLRYGYSRRRKCTRQKGAQRHSYDRYEEVAISRRYPARVCDRSLECANTNRFANAGQRGGGKPFRRLSGSPHVGLGPYGEGSLQRQDSRHRYELRIGRYDYTWRVDRDRHGPLGHGYLRQPADVEVIRIRDYDRQRELLGDGLRNRFRRGVWGG